MVATDHGNTLRLHIGGMEVKEGWKILNVQSGPGVDYVGNVTDLSAFDDNCVAEIYCSHVLEHLGYITELPRALAEVHRVLQAGGNFKISVPDMDVLCRLFIDSRIDVKGRYLIQRMLFGGQVDEHDFHKVGLNIEFLTIFLNEAGFKKITRVQEFGLFNDASSVKLGGQLISLNVIAEK